MNDLKKHVIIKCPKCGYEYLASEIFYPQSLLGSGPNPLRDGEEPELEEDWECYNCGCNFKAKIEMRGCSIYHQNYDFSEDYVITNEEDKEKLF